MVKFITISEAMQKGKGKVAVRGWVYRERGSNKLKFIVLRDHTDVIQCVLKRENFEDQWKDIDSLQIEASIEVEGTIKEDKRAPSGYEISVSKINVVGKSNEFPINKDLNEELLGDRRHLWLRSRKMSSAMKIRSTVMFALHEYMHKNGFTEIEAPSLSGASSEGGSEVFELNYFGKKAYLTQSWQFYAENFIHSVGKAYAMAPSFRAEKSKTPWHVTEFWHFEVEGAWMDLEDDMKIAEESIVYAIKKVLKENKKDLDVLGADISFLKKIKSPFKRITYEEAVKTLQNNGHKIKYGDDFGSAEERGLAKYYGDNFVFVTNYPLELLKFYHGEDLKKPGTGTNFNLLAPGVGEMVDGSQREPDLKKIVERLKKAKIDLGASDWYLDSRRYGSVPHAGFGLGLERFVAWICGFKTIKDAIPFPRTPTRLNP
ncbi:asparagine--tRNA ligase [Candidatus Pacearchaeota archaeon ex4484_71]|nr:MAG: asparagine--tRNA ligase [Candidatus Pacearchaeota archaeon ex4484_71]